MHGWIAVAACMTLGACGGSRSTSLLPPPSAPENGLYAFSASTPNQHIRGTIRVGEGGMGIEFETNCQPEATTRPLPRGMPTTSSVSRHYCSGAWLEFGRQNPTVAKWYASVEVPRQREVCDRYQTQNGRRVCVSRSIETYNVVETRSGGIIVRRIP